MSTAVVEHLRVEWRSALRNPSQLLLTYLFPVAFFGVLGAVMPEINPGFRSYMVPSFALFAVLAASVLGLPPPLVDARNAGVLRAFRVLGVPDLAALGVPSLATALHALLAAGLITALAIGLYDGAAPVHWGGYLAVLALAAFSLAGLGTLIGVVSPSGRATMLWSQGIFLPSMLLGGMMIPVSTLPARVQPLALALPSTHLMQLFASLGSDGPTLVPAWASACALLGTGVAAFGLAALLFDSEPRENRRWRGLLVPLTLLPLALTALLA